MFSKNVIVRFARLSFVFVLSSASWATPFFQSPQTYGSGGWNTFSIAVADVNRDGHPDLLVTSTCSRIACNAGSRGLVGVLLGNGDGTFQPVRNYDSGGYGANSVVAADVNRDGNPDLLVVNYCGDENCLGNVGVLFGNGDGTFQPAQSYSTGAFRASSLALADLNGDGSTDLLVSNSCLVIENCGELNSTTPGAIGVLMGQSNGSFEPAKTYDPGGIRTALVLVGDTNGDGYDDLLAVNPCSSADCGASSITMLAGNGDGTFQPSALVGLGGAQSGTLALADLNEDGKLDIVAGDYNTVRASLGNGDGTFQSPAPFDTGAERVLTLTTGDVNGDGKADVIAGSLCEPGYGCHFGMISVLLGNGDGTLQKARTFTSYGKDASGVVLEDVNGDTRPDLLVANSCARLSGCRTEGSAVVFLNRSPVRTMTSLASNLSPSTYGQTVTLTAAVTSIGQVIPTGTVSFWNGGALIRTVPLTGNTATVSTRILPVGILSITATYNGDDQSGKSTSASYSQVVNPATSITNVASSVNPSAQGQSVIFTAKVTSPTTTVTGTVTFTAGATTLGTVALKGGKGLIITSALPKGNSRITAIYNGTSNITESADSLAQLVR